MSKSKKKGDKKDENPGELTEAQEKALNVQ